jgi:predicted PurR-regulated permease PerM
MSTDTIWSVTRSFAVLLVLAFFLFAIQVQLGPFFLYLVLLVLLLPKESVSARNLLLWVTSGLVLIWVLLTAGSVLAPFVVAMVLAYLLDPIVDRLEERGMGRGLAIAVLVVPALAGLVVAASIGLPSLERQARELVAATPGALDRLALWAQEADTLVGRVPFVGPMLQERLGGIDAAEIADFLETRLDEMFARMWSAVLGVGRGVGMLVSLLGYVILTPVLAFYLLRDWNTLVRHLGELVPRDRKESIFALAHEYDRLLGRYLRGQIMVALLMGLLTALGLWAWGFPYAFLVGSLVAVFSVVPYVGLALSLLPAVIIALLSGSVGYSLLKVAVVFGVVQGLEGTVISPRIVGDSVGLHPVWIVLAITAGGYFFGFVGLLLAVPVAAGIKILALRGVERYRTSSAYLGESSTDPA